MKRFLDFFLSLMALLLCSPAMLLFMLLVWLQDFKNPFYVANRVGKNFTLFKMVKLRSMVVNADKTGIASTSKNDMRITNVGKLIRKFKLDEITQFWNVLRGDMSLVGPRPNVKSEVDLYTNAERGLLSVRPGITDFSSIVFSDEDDILSSSTDPDLDYNLLIRPWKSRLGLIYIDKRNLLLDIRLIFTTVIAIINKSLALKIIHTILSKYSGISEELIEVVKRDKPLVKSEPPTT